MRPKRQGHPSNNRHSSNRKYMNLAAEESCQTYPLKCEKTNVRFWPGYLPFIYFCAVLLRLSVEPTPCITLPLASTTFQTFFFSIRGRLEINSLTCITHSLFLSFYYTNILYRVNTVRLFRESCHLHGYDT